MTSRQDRLYITRIDRFADRLKNQILVDRVDLNVSFAPCDGEVTFEQRSDLKWQPIRAGDVWGRNREVGWFRLTGQVPSQWTSEQVLVRLDVGGEGLVFDAHGGIIQGISNGSVFDHEFNRDLVRLGDNGPGGEKLELWVEATASGLFGLFTEADPSANAPNRYGEYEARLNAAELCAFDKNAWHLWLDLETVRDLLKVVPVDSPRHARLLRVANQVIDAFSIGKSPVECRAVLGEELGKKASASSLKATAVGHAHIDTAWLWPVRESVRKCARTFGSQLALIERYPDYVFGASQAQHYAFVREHYPDLYERVKKAVADGRWEIQGGMWVEADCNLISGESMIRQILHGKNFFRDEFGVEVDNLWLPDVFGYSAALPQILKRSGIECFVTQKMSWNQFNEFPYHTFIWRGIDGSDILTHFPPENNYNSSLRPESLVKAEHRYHERGIVDEFLSLFGVGDGGGGPKEEHIEFGLRQGDIEGAPKVSFGKAADFFARLQKHRDALPSWLGELYLELHRGTLTTQAKIKRLNRNLENKLRVTEMLYSCGSMELYPCDELDHLWKTVLRNQFHDIIPGSSITEVYRTTESELTDVAESLDRLAQRAAGTLFRVDDDALVLFNPTSYRYHGEVALPDGWMGSSDHAACQNEDGTTVLAVEVEPLSFVTLRKADVEPDTTQSRDELVLENPLVRYEFASDGRLVRGRDKELGREIVRDGQPGNVLTLYDDRPNDWDAWDVDLFYEGAAIGSQTEVECGAVQVGPVRQTLKVRTSVGDSEIIQVISLGALSKRLDFTTTVSWRESHKMLRVAFPVDVLSDQASFDIQYGYVKRPTHRNTSWDLARFEVVGHKYADLSEPDYGVALLNDCKYGYKVFGEVLDLCLLRSPTYPDPDADRGEQQFTYSLLPHAGDLVRSDVMAQATLLNLPPLLVSGCDADNVELPVRVEGEGVSLEVVKKAEKDDCLVFRLVETFGCHARAKLTIGSGSVLIETDLMEGNDAAPHDRAREVEVSLRPFEIRTYKLQYK